MHKLFGLKNSEPKTLFLERGHKRLQSRSGRSGCASKQDKNQRSPSGCLGEQVCSEVSDWAAGRRAVEGKSSSVDRRQVPRPLTLSQSRDPSVAEDTAAVRSFNVGHSHAPANAHPASSNTGPTLVINTQALSTSICTESRSMEEVLYAQRKAVLFRYSPLKTVSV